MNLLLPLTKSTQMDVLIGALVFLLVIYAILKAFPRLKKWIEQIVFNSVSIIVNTFWEQQSSKIQDSQKERKKKQKKQNEKKTMETLKDGILVDTSVLIDGRILDIVRVGFINSLLIIPKSVVNELHLLSDNEDTVRRNKGRKGLDNIKSLKSLTRVIMFNQKPLSDQTDKDLVEIAKKFKLRIMTMDFNLNKVAQLNNVKVLNINELVNVLKTPVIPGEHLRVMLIQEGKESNQGVGYMPDGTMVVVEGAKDLIGTEVDTVVSRLIQSNAGKIIFCKLPEAK